MFFFQTFFKQNRHILSSNGLKGEIQQSLNQEKNVVLGEKSLFCRRRKKAVNMYSNNGFGAFSRRCTHRKLPVCYIWQQRYLTLNVRRNAPALVLCFGFVFWVFFSHANYKEKPDEEHLWSRRELADAQSFRPFSHVRLSKENSRFAEG